MVGDIVACRCDVRAAQSCVENTGMTVHRTGGGASVVLQTQKDPRMSSKEMQDISKVSIALMGRASF